MLEDGMNQFEELANWASDQETQWWPFGFLRPEQHERMSNRRVLALSILYGTFAGFLMNVAARLGGAPAGLRPWLLPALGTAGFFLLFRMTFALCWNRRADRLDGQKP